MAWERGYYYRVRRENGRVVREYVGRGQAAQIVAQMDALDREKERLDVAALRHEQAELEALDAVIETLIETTELLARAALVTAGYHQHNRGEWRRHRERQDAKR